MTHQKIAAIVFGALVSLGGCALVIGVDTHDVGTGDGGHGSGSGSGTDAGPACSSSQMCTGTPTPACDVADGVCVQCIAGETAACTGTTPVCADDHACRGCDAHTECASSAVCQTDGSCAVEDTVAYVAPGGSNPSCTQLAPCGSLVVALQTGKKIIKVKGGGTVSTTGTTAIAGNVAIYGDPGATIGRQDSGPVVTITGGAVSLSDVTISNGIKGPTDGTGILVSGGAAMVTLERVTLADNAGYGLYTDTAGGAQIRVNDSTISGNHLGGIVTSVSSQIQVARSKVTGNFGVGIAVPAGTLDVSQSTISGNAEGGISTTATFAITNNYIVVNGTARTGTFAASMVGGVSLGGTGATDSFEFNTVADNAAMAFQPGGVACTVMSFSVDNNIIAGNVAGASSGGGTVPANTAASLCTYALSNVIVDDEGALQFTGGGDYRINAGSTARDHATTNSLVSVDNEGTVRPQGSGKDAGANEMIVQ